MAIRSNPTQWVQRWQQGVATAGQRYVQGVQTAASWVNGFTAAEQRMITGLQTALADGRITRGVQNLGDTNWKNITVAKAANWQTGVNAATAKATAGANVLFGFLNNAENAISGLPRGDFNQNMARLTAWVTSIHNDSVAYKATH